MYRISAFLHLEVYSSLAGVVEERTDVLYVFTRTFQELRTTTAMKVLSVFSECLARCSGYHGLSKAP